MNHNIQDDVTGFPTRPILSGGVTVDMGAIEDEIRRWRGQPGTIVVHANEKDVVTLPPLDTETFLAWARYKELDILGKDLSGALRSVREGLVSSASQGDEYERLLIVRGADIHALILESSAGPLASEEVDGLLRVLEAPLPLRWELLLESSQ